MSEWPHAWVLSHVLFVPMTETTTALPSEPGRWQEVSGTIGLPVFDQGGMQSVPVFTSEAELARWNDSDDARYIALPAPGVLEAFLGTPADRLVVDNASRRAFAIGRDEAQALLEIDARIPNDAPVMQLRPPPEEAAPLVHVLRGACARHPEIREAYLYRGFRTTRDAPMDIPDEAWRHTLLYGFGEDTSDDRIQEVLRAVGERLHEAVSVQEVLMPPSGIALQVARGASDWLRTVSRTGAPIVAVVTEEHMTNAPAAVGKPSRTPPAGLLDDVQRIGEADDAVIEITYHQVAFLDRNTGLELAIGVRLRDGTDQQHERTLIRTLGAALTPDRWGYDNISMLIEPPDAPRECRTTIFRRA